MGLPRQAGINQQQEDVIDYLREEVRVSKEIGANVTFELSASTRDCFELLAARKGRGRYVFTGSHLDSPLSA